MTTRAGNPTPHLTMNYDDILTYCRSKNPALIYVGIGCAQGHHPPDNEDNWAQEYPPVLAMETRGYRIAILIDPALERPVRALRDVGLDGSHDVVEDPHVGITFICVRHLFHWPRTYESPIAAPHTAFIHQLCEMAVYSESTQLIVQDYTGFDIRPYYPLNQFNHNKLKDRVLYDMTYTGGGCSVDFTKVNVLRRASGDFIQPHYTPLLTLKSLGAPAKIIANEAASRREILELFVHRYYHVLCGNKEPRHWCTEDHVMNAAEYLFYTYGLIPSVVPTNLRALMAEALLDFLAIRSTHLCLADMYTLIDSPTTDYSIALRITTPATASPLPLGDPSV
jgi:hypothetical protein